MLNVESPESRELGQTMNVCVENYMRQLFHYPLARGFWRTKESRQTLVHPGLRWRS